MKNWNMTRVCLLAVAAMVWWLGWLGSSELCITVVTVAGSSFTLFSLLWLMILKIEIISRGTCVHAWMFECVCVYVVFFLVTYSRMIIVYYSSEAHSVCSYMACVSVSCFWCKPCSIGHLPRHATVSTLIIIIPDNSSAIMDLKKKIGSVFWLLGCSFQVFKIIEWIRMNDF